MKTQNNEYRAKIFCVVTSREKAEDEKRTIIQQVKQLNRHEHLLDACLIVVAKLTLQTHVSIPQTSYARDLCTTTHEVVTKFTLFWSRGSSFSLQSL